MFIRSDAGQRQSDDLLDCKARLKELRGRYKACASSINTAKAEIDDLTDAIQEKKVSGKKEVKMDGHGELEGFEGPKANMYLKGYADKKKYGTLEEAGEAFSSVENAGGIVYDGKHYTIRKKGGAQECSQPNILWLYN